ncbi:hypothetical protein JZM24_01515 [Candidatus Sodalis endolongispinus]|uniref:protein-secreting ATPase n=1 Tax=Candidatus Sodalis endolongispinus TaxID=2812662 RepID=A0ABS5Y8A6_9GAMM|nr:hypothetical protein [Candidatus Sodalis endolongispinus]
MAAYTRDEIRNNRDRLPGLGSLPLIGGLFHHRIDKQANTVRIFLIQPREISEPLQQDTAAFARSIVARSHAGTLNPRRHQCVLVYATSNYSSLERCNTALVATTVAEYFRDQGRRVVLFLDSLTRFSRALRDVALAAGEAPARRGYPASVFDALPRILERPGNSPTGSITAFYTVLLEGDDEQDPIADEIRSILDGHIYLSRKLAAANHFPAIDILRSASRVAGQVTDARQQALAGAMRGLLTRLEEMQTLIDLGEYRPGDNAENDHAQAKKQLLWDFLRQDAEKAEEFGQTLRLMHAFEA